MMPLEFVLDRASNPRKVGDGYHVSCPLPEHAQGRGDRNPSVSVTDGDDGRALVNYQAGCRTEDIVAAWGLEMSDLFEQRNGHKKSSVLSPENNCNRATNKEVSDVKHLNNGLSRVTHHRSRKESQ
jgi:hypothetical protein